MNSEISVERKLSAIMFADIVSYSRLMGADESEALKLLNDFDEISGKIIQKFDGTIIKKNGDQIFCEFSSAKNAVDASLELQNKLGQYNDSRPKDFKLEVRIGIHIGDIVKKDNDIFGDGVNVAARIQPLASPGGICVSGAVSESLSSHPHYDIVSKGEQELKNILQKHTIFQVKTGYETIEPSVSIGDKDTKKAKSTKAYLGMGLLLCTLIGYFSYTKLYSEDAKEVYQNFYLHFTSSKNYIDHYYKDYGFGSSHFYDKDKFQIESISDSLLKEIRSKVFSKISSTFSNHDLTIDASFYENEREILDKFFFIKINQPNEDELNALKISTDKFSEIIRKRIDYYTNGGLPDVLVRFFVYKVKDIEKNEEYLIMDRGATWGNHLKEAAGNVSWSVDQSTYDIDIKGVDKLVKRIHEMSSMGINNLAYGDFRVGKVIELLDDDMVKIMMKKPGVLKNKMRISSHRTYHWVVGGAEDRIEDITQLLESLNKNDLRTFWKHYSYTSSEPFDEEKVKMKRDEGIKHLNFEIQQIREKMKNNTYGENTTSDMDDMSYFMEVIETIDSVAIARITGSTAPVYRVRIGDYVRIDN